MSMVGGGGKNSQEVDLQIAPIIDCFVVLIAFLLVSAAFLSIGILDAGVANSVSSQKKSTPPAIQVSILMKSDYSIHLKTKGKSRVSRRFQAVEGQWNHEALQAELSRLQKSWPDVKGVTLSAQDQIVYEDVVVTMDRIRSTHPAVLLSGF